MYPALEILGQRDTALCGSLPCPERRWHDRATYGCPYDLAKTLSALGIIVGLSAPTHFRIRHCQAPIEASARSGIHPHPATEEQATEPGREPTVKLVTVQKRAYQPLRSPRRFRTSEFRPRKRPLGMGGDYPRYKRFAHAHESRRCRTMLRTLINEGGRRWPRIKEVFLINRILK